MKNRWLSGLLALLSALGATFAYLTATMNGSFYVASESAEFASRGAFWNAMTLALVASTIVFGVLTVRRR